VSIAAEIIARRWGGGGKPLTEVDGRIHHDLRAEFRLPA
jgi:xanthine dehydrogenase accessory factor